MGRESKLPDSENISSMSEVGKLWSPRKYPETLYRYMIYLFFLTFIGFSLHFLKIPITRLLTSFGPFGRILIQEYSPPDLTYISSIDFLKSVLETFQISVLATFLGLSFSVPISWLAAYNVTPNRLVCYPIGRLCIIVARAVDPVIWALLLVSLLGFGPFSGTLALIILAIGFTGKLFAEEIEAIDPGQVEAIKATGAGKIQIFFTAVIPQVKVAWVGISIYTWDAIFRASTILGFFGAGGMGWYLRRTTQTLAYEQTAAILLSILALVIISEITSIYIRKKIA